MAFSVDPSRRRFVEETAAKMANDMDAWNALRPRFYPGCQLAGGEINFPEIPPFTGVPSGHNHTFANDNRLTFDGEFHWITYDDGFTQLICPHDINPAKENPMPITTDSPRPTPSVADEVAASRRAERERARIEGLYAGFDASPLPTAPRSVIRFDRTFPADFMRNTAERIYTYSGVFCGNGKWFLTGSVDIPRSGATPDELVDWFVAAGIERSAIEVLDPATADVPDPTTK